ncbi:DNA mismatch repair protein MutT [Thermodesulfomicrobium sp. WS]|uniref:NUDIX domain-containing protein n=1 Tax=Thermodesulfomicrobium sp. WS TaxID=3004129 RepID=UPI002491420F|nr:NUDIX domain-containing protein [Thermodesulfomicrobium sp. WS]BDV00010.1 DNA mismatch repair protein MutT [Thermodesulfomicrobium sp. WS]
MPAGIDAHAVLVVAGILTRGHEILLARRPEHKHLGGLWEFPGGKVDAGEGLKDALSRELAEELGITVRAACLWKTVEKRRRDSVLRLTVFHVAFWQGEPVGREGQQLGWFSPRQALDLPLVDMDAALLAQLARLWDQEGVWPFFCTG